MSESSRTYLLPILPLKSTVVFPYVTMPISIQRPGSIAAVDAALATEGKMIAVFTQYNPMVEDSKIRDLHPVGTSATIKLIARSNSMIQLIMQAIERVEIAEPETESPFLKARVRTLPIVVGWGSRSRRCNVK